MNAIEAHQLTKRYPSGNSTLTVLSEVSFQLRAGATCAVMGPSGSGKTTLLGLLAGLDLPNEGMVAVNGQELTQMNEEQRAQFRRQEIGFVFQNFRLIPTLTALENVMVPVELNGDPEASSKAQEILGRVGLSERKNHYPIQLSGGEQQRVALARAFIHEPRLLFADEPTGNLDAVTAEAVIQLLFNLNLTQKTTLVIVTHNPDLAKLTDHVLQLSGGKIVGN